MTNLGPNVSAEGAAVGAGAGYFVVWLIEWGLTTDVPPVPEMGLVGLIAYGFARLLPPR
jgi:hypothetical protein